MKKLSEQTIINFLNNWNGIICEEVVCDVIEFYGNYSLGDMVDIGIRAEIIDLKYFPNAIPSNGLVVYKMKGKAVIDRL